MDMQNLKPEVFRTNRSFREDDESPWSKRNSPEIPATTSPLLHTMTGTFCTAAQFLQSGRSFHESTDFPENIRIIMVCNGVMYSRKIVHRVGTGFAL